MSKSIRVRPHSRVQHFRPGRDVGINLQEYATCQECRNPTVRPVMRAVPYRVGDQIRFAVAEQPAETYTMDELPDEAITSAEVGDRQFAALKASGEYDLYTQVADANVKDDIYVKGNVLENRTGVYALVPKETA